MVPFRLDGYRLSQVHFRALSSSSWIGTGQIKNRGREDRDMVTYAHKKSHRAAKPFQRSVKIRDRFSSPSSFQRTIAQNDNSPSTGCLIQFRDEKTMKLQVQQKFAIKIKDLHTSSMEVTDAGIELEFRDSKGTHVGDLKITPTRLVWNPGRTSTAGKSLNWPEVFKLTKKRD